MAAKGFEDRCRDNLFAIVAEYRRIAKCPLSTVSKRAYGNANFLADFKRGTKSLSLKKFGEVVEWFRANWPDGAAWPYVPLIKL